MPQHIRQTGMGAWTASEKLFAGAALVCTGFGAYLAAIGGRFAPFVVGAFALGISWWAARRARIKDD